MATAQHKWRGSSSRSVNRSAQEVQAETSGSEHSPRPGKPKP